MNIDIRYSTRFLYPWPVHESQNELRACPVTDARQQLLAYRISTVPQSRVFSYADHWDTRVDAFGVRTPHSSLEIVAEAQVETGPQRPLTVSCRRDRLEDPAFREEHLEYLVRTRHADWGPAVTEEATRRAEWAAEDVVSTVLAIHRGVNTTLDYAPGSTYIGVDVDEVLSRRAGVCQDFAHLAVAMCRSVGIPARYVSGYLFTSDDSRGDEPTDDDTVTVQTHAWFEAAIPGGGWWGLDPTNGREIGTRHVKIGHGRDYDDVAPLRGCFSGPTDHQMDVSVQIGRSTGPVEVIERRMIAPGAIQPLSRPRGALQQQPQQQ